MNSLFGGASEKAMTLRLPADDADALDVIARASGRPVTVEVREAIAAYITARKADPEFARKARVVADEWQTFAASCGESRV